MSDPPERRLFPSVLRELRLGSSIAIRVWFVFGGLIFIILVATLILLNSMDTVNDDITRITNVEEVITAAAYEMEINVNGTGMAVLQYLDVPDKEYRIRVAEDQADFERFQAQFDDLASTPEERALAAEVAGLYTEFKALGVTLMAQKDQQERLFRIAGISFGEIDSIIDEAELNVGTQTPFGLEKIALEAAEVGAWLGNYLRVGSEEYRMKIIEDTAQFWEAASLARDLATNATQESAISSVEYVFGLASEGVDEIVAVHDSIEVGIARFTELRGQLDNLLDEEIQRLALEALSSSRLEAHTSVAWMQWVIRVMIGASLVAGSLAIRFLIRGILGPVHRLAEGAEELGQGHLDFRVQVESDDELGEVAKAFNLMAEQRQRASSRLEDLVSERTAELRSSEAGHRALLEAIPDSILRIDANGAILESRMASNAVFSNLDGEALFELLPPDAVVNAQQQITQALATRSVSVFEYQFTSNGRERDFEARVVPIEGGDDLVVIDRDVSEQKAAERQLTELVRSKTEFLASVSHELRTPLTAVLGFAELLVQSEFELEEDERKDMMKSIAQQASDVTSIVEDLLVAARSELGEVEVVRKPVQLLSQLAQVVEMLKPAPPLEICDGEAVTALGDPARVRQIIRNVVTNAVRYGGEQLYAEVGASDSVAHLRIRDDGDGLPLDMWERIFEPYQRAHDRYTQPAAVGIGLTISRDLARLMEGDLAYSYVDGWSTFELTLPLA